MNLIKGKAKPQSSLGFCLNRHRYVHKKRKKNSERKPAGTARGTAAKAHVAGH